MPPASPLPASPLLPPGAPSPPSGRPKARRAAAIDSTTAARGESVASNTPSASSRRKYPSAHAGHRPTSAWTEVQMPKRPRVNNRQVWGPSKKRRQAGQQPPTPPKKKNHKWMTRLPGGRRCRRGSRSPRRRPACRCSGIPSQGSPAAPGRIQPRRISAIRMPFNIAKTLIHHSNW